MLPSFQFVKTIILLSLLNETWSDQTNYLKRFKRGTNKEYAAIIDGGSSGSRIRVYAWESVSHDDQKALPDFKEILNKKKSPGVSDYEDKQAELRDYFKDLINAALLEIPDAAHSRTDLYFMATAGMRLLLEDKANSMIERIDKLLADKSFHPMRYLSPDNSRILSGEEEGVFAWISVNYLKNVFKEKNVRPAKTYGILELGGASTQIAFAPSGNILADKFPVLISGVNYYLYVHSYLYYGQNYVDQWLKTALYENQSKDASINVLEIKNPCMVKGDVQQKEIDKKNLTFIGSGNYTWCQTVLNDFVYRVHDSWKCNPKPCAIGTVYQPTIKPSMEFIAIGAFVHAFNKLKVLSKDGKFSYPVTQNRVEYFCGLQKDEVLVQFPPDEDAYTSVPCLMGTYSPMLFIRGYRFPENTEQIYVKKDIDGRSADWTLGAIIYEYEKSPHRHEYSCPISQSNRPVASKAATFLIFSLCFIFNLTKFTFTILQYF